MHTPYAPTHTHTTYSRICIYICLYVCISLYLCVRAFIYSFTIPSLAHAGPREAIDTPSESVHTWLGVAWPLFFVCWKIMEINNGWLDKNELVSCFVLSFMAETLRAFWSPFTLSKSKSSLLEDLRGAHFCKVPFVAAQYSLHMFISKSSSASFGGSRFCASGARKLEYLGLPKRVRTV